MIENMEQFTQFVKEITGKDYKDINVKDLINSKTEGHFVDAFIAKIAYMFIQVFKKSQAAPIIGTPANPIKRSVSNPQPILLYFNNKF